jgi:hypothetical protein
MWTTSISAAAALPSLPVRNRKENSFDRVERAGFGVDPILQLLRHHGVDKLVISAKARNQLISTPGHKSSLYVNGLAAETRTRQSPASRRGSGYENIWSRS